MAKPTLVNAQFIRESFRNGGFTVTDAALPAFNAGPQGRGRGRLPKDAIAAFEAENPGYRYAGENSELETKRVEVPMFSPKTGRPVKPVVKTLSEVRVAAGVVGKKGRLSKAELQRAAVAFGSGEPKAAPVKVVKAKAPVKAKRAPKAKAAKA